MMLHFIAWATGTNITVYDERVTLIATKIQEYIFLAPEFKFTVITSKGHGKLTYCHPMTLAGEDSILTCADFMSLYSLFRHTMRDHANSQQQNGQRGAVPEGHCEQGISGR
jgi:hypothetical protein